MIGKMDRHDEWCRENQRGYLDREDNWYFPGGGGYLDDSQGPCKREGGSGYEKRSR